MFRHLPRHPTVKEPHTDIDRFLGFSPESQKTIDETVAKFRKQGSHMRKEHVRVALQMAYGHLYRYNLAKNSTCLSYYKRFSNVKLYVPQAP